MKAPTVTALLDKLRTRKHNYRSAFGAGAPAQKALLDLGRFCRAYGGGEVIPGDHDRTLILAGRREAYFRILDHLHFEPDELAQLYRATKLQSGDE